MIFMKSETNEEIISSLKSNQLKVTKSRVAVLALLAKTSKPMTHSEIMEKLNTEEHWDRVTIYRTLSEFEEKRMVKSLLSNDRISYFELQDSLHEHGHISCENCGKIDCLEKDQFQFSLGKINNFKVNRVEIVLKGLCENCI